MIELIGLNPSCGSAQLDLDFFLVSQIYSLIHHGNDPALPTTFVHTRPYAMR